METVKYQFKYEFKGNDQATVTLLQEDPGKPKNEVKEFVNSRMIDAHQSIWRIFEYPLHGRYPAVMRLAVHEEDKQFVTFQKGQEDAAIDNPKKTTLMAWFEYNKLNNDAEGDNYDEEAPNTTYLDFPKKYTYNVSKRVWTKRKKGSGGVPCVGRLNTVARSTDERYFLRMLLHHITGAASFEDMKTYQDVVYDTYKETAMAMGLLSDDNEIIFAMEETSLYGNSSKLRNLFAMFLKHGEVTRPLQIFEQFKDDLMSDLLYEKRKESADISVSLVENDCLIQLDDIRGR